MENSNPAPMPSHATHPANAPAAASRLSLEGAASRARLIAALVGIAGLGAAAALGYGDGWHYFSRSYLVNWTFFATISLGGLFFVAVQHATRAGWSVTVRRLAELFGANVPLLAVLLLPILVPVLVKSDVLYPWLNPDTVAHDAALQHKSPWLNSEWFGIRAVAYLTIWVLLGRFYLVRSLRQDMTADVQPTLSMERISPVALLLFAATSTFASFDWLMSLEPVWYSTIYGVYFFGGIAVAVFAALVLAAVALQASGRLVNEITVEHYHDLGKLLFAFVVFWGYIAFSQYLLIWYGNIPEETTYYLQRQTGVWTPASLALIFGHLIIPLFGLLSRHVKRSRPLLAFWAVWLLVMHWLDLYWLVMPSRPAEVVASPTIDACCFVGIGGIWLAGWFHLAGNRALAPVADPRLREALNFENV